MYIQVLYLRHQLTARPAPNSDASSLSIRFASNPQSCAIRLRTNLAACNLLRQLELGRPLD